MSRAPMVNCDDMGVIKEHRRSLNSCISSLRFEPPCDKRGETPHWRAKLCTVHTDTTSARGAVSAEVRCSACESACERAATTPDKGDA